VGPSVPPVAAADRFTSPQAYTPKHLAEKILTSRTAMEGERKQVTVLFTDVSGFTAMSSRLDPEEVHDIMDRCFEIFLGAVHRYEGTINQFLGDGVMALFGAPIAHEDHPHRAVRAALAIERDLVPLRDDVHGSYGVEFRVRIGINTGLVVVGAIGTDLRMDYTALGDTVNLASRLLNLAQPGQIVVSQRTRQRTDGYFVFGDLGEFQVKGKVEPVRAYAVTGELAGRTRLEVSRERGLTPLIGRERELKRLMDAYRRTAEGGAAAVVITGEPGVGKSRLLYEFLCRLDAAGTRELSTACLSYGRTLPYHPILDLLRRELEIPDDMSAGDIRVRVGARLRALGRDSDESATLLAHLLGAPAPRDVLARLEPAQLKQRTFAVACEVLLAAGDGGLAVIVIENVHWLDASSEELLQHLVRSLPGHRVLLLLSGRPDFRAPWLAPPVAETIAVEGLQSDQVGGMIRALVGAPDIPDSLVELLIAKSDGNPLYLEEILRELRETGGIVLDGSRAHLSEANVSVPRTVNDIIAARIDRLAEPLKQALQSAAVVGRQFAVALLTRLLEEPNEVVLDQLDELNNLDFVFLVDRLLYSFKHALTQEVVYGGLLERRRRRLHGIVASAMEELYAGRIEEVAEVLAYHFGRSGETEQAVDYAIMAAEKAQRRWAHIEALAQFDAALKLLDSLPDNEVNRARRIDAVTKQAEIKFALGRHAEHIHALEGIRDLVERSPDPRRRAAWYYWTGFLHSLTGARPEVAIAYCRQASDIADAENLDDIRGFAESCLAQAYTIAGRLQEALAAGERALGLFEARGNIWWTCRTLWIMSTAANAVGDWSRSLECCRRALQHGQDVEDRRLKVVGWWRTGSTHIHRGDPETGLACCEEALALSPIPFDLAQVRSARGHGLIKAGDFAAGIAALRESVTWFEKSGLRFPRSAFGLFLADGYLRQGEWQLARQEAEAILAICREVGYRHIECVAERLLGEALQAADPAAAAPHLATALHLAEEIGSKVETAKALLAQADAARAAGDRPSAGAFLERSLRLSEELGTIDDAARARRALASLVTA
jgi:class 3 adenylate cyclase/tetratricopeptide (TPR) repeat protein